MSPIDRDLIERACEKLVKQFAVFNDLGELDRMADLFTEDGTFARPLDPANPTIGRPAILAMLQSRPPRLSRHYMTNILVDVVSENEATGISFVTFLTTTEVDAPRPVVCEPKMFMGEYRDTFVGTTDGWKIKSRQGSLAMIFEP
jgi:hypothetical protein